MYIPSIAVAGQNLEVVVLPSSLADEAAIARHHDVTMHDGYFLARDVIEEQPDTLQLVGESALAAGAWRQL